MMKFAFYFKKLNINFIFELLLLLFYSKIFYK